MNEAETCRILVRPKLEQAGWDGNRHFYSEQISFTDGRIVLPAGKPKRLKQKFADFLLRFSRDITLGVVEAKAQDKPAGNGLQQAKEYAEILDLPFAFATNGHEIIEYDYFSSIESVIERFPTPEELWTRYQIGKGFSQAITDALLVPFFHQPGREPRYYQKIAIQRAVEAILSGTRRNLLTMATGTGKTVVAFQIAWKLWSAGWNAKGEHRKPRILFLADRNVLVDDPKDKTFSPFGDARWKIQGEAIKSREMYFAIYQAIAQDERRPGLYRDYAPDFFDLIIIDECHRGSANDESSWREILDYFVGAYQLGMTATPLREDNRDTYLYFGNPLFKYSLKQGIADGFLAPYRVHRVLTSVDATGWRPNKGQKDARGRIIPDGEYHTKDFEKQGSVSLEARTKAIAKHISDFLRKTDRHSKTIVFCVDQEHADEMRRALSNENADLVHQLNQQGEEYVARVTADEGNIGKGFLSKFQDPEEPAPVILTTSQLLTTGVDAPTCKNVALVRVIGSMSEFKQIIGRGTRVREDRDKLFFNILDYTGQQHKCLPIPTLTETLPRSLPKQLMKQAKPLKDLRQAKNRNRTIRMKMAQVNQNLRTSSRNLESFTSKGAKLRLTLPSPTISIPTAANFVQLKYEAMSKRPLKRSTQMLMIFGVSGATSYNAQQSSKPLKIKGSTSTSWPLHSISLTRSLRSLVSYSLRCSTANAARTCGTLA